MLRAASDENARMEQHVSTEAPLRVAVVGAGAVGGLVGHRLAAAGHDTSALARGATLAALVAHGWRVQGERAEPVRAAERATDLGEHDVVVLAVKATALDAALAEQVAALLAPDGVVVTAMNGVPWWFAVDGGPLDSVDPGGALARALPRERVLGAVVHLASAVVEPGLVRSNGGNGLIVGEAAGGPSRRVDRVVGALTGAGFDATASDDVRVDVWFKLWGNMTMNPISMLSGATADRILDDPLVERFCLDVMAEAAHVGAEIGCTITEDGPARVAVTRRLGALRTSMLQDAEAGRPIELDALVGSVREIGERVGVPTPAIDTLLGLTRLTARTRGLYPQARDPSRG